MSVGENIGQTLLVQVSEGQSAVIIGQTWTSQGKGAYNAHHDRTKIEQARAQQKGRQEDSRLPKPSEREERADTQDVLGYAQRPRRRGRAIRRLPRQQGVRNAA